MEFVVGSAVAEVAHRLKWSERLLLILAGSLGIIFAILKSSVNGSAAPTSVIGFVEFVKTALPFLAVSFWIGIFVRARFALQDQLTQSTQQQQTKLQETAQQLQTQLKVDMQQARNDLTAIEDRLTTNINDLVRSLSAAEERLEYIRDNTIADQSKQIAKLDEAFKALSGKIEQVRELVQERIPEFVHTLVDSKHEKILDTLLTGVEMLDQKAAQNIKRSAPIKKTAEQIYDDIFSLESLQRQPRTRDYLGSYVSWDCWIVEKERKEGGLIYCTCRVTPDVNIKKQILVSLHLREETSRSVVLMKDGEVIKVIGRILGIRSLPYMGLGFTLDDIEIQ